MPEENQGVETPEVDDKTIIKNLKAEFNRKQSEQKEILNQLVNSQAQLQAALTELTSQRQPRREEVQEEVDLEALMYKDPRAYAKIISDDAVNRALAQFRQETSTTQSVQGAIATLNNDYPELQDANNDLTKKAVEILKGMTDSEKSNPRTYEYAVLKAAGELDIKPRSKRPTPEEDFVAPSYSSPQGRRSKKTQDSVVESNKGIAAEFGINLEDPKMKEKYLNLLKSKGVI